MHQISSNNFHYHICVIVDEQGTKILIKFLNMLWGDWKGNVISMWMAMWMSEKKVQRFQMHGLRVLEKKEFQSWKKQF